MKRAALIGLLLAARAQVGVFVPGPSIGDSRAAHTATVLTDGRILIAGGANGTTALSSAVLVDPMSKAVAPAGALQSARASHTATLLKDGRVLIAGGESFSQPGARTPLASAEIYDPASGRFTTTGSMMSKRVRHAAVLLPNGKVLIAGGTGETSATGVIAVYSTAELYDPSSGQFSAAASMSVTRSGHTATLLKNGSALIVGSGSAEIYDSSTNRFMRAAAPIAVRVAHTATLLDDGQVLLAGGSVDNAASATAERYDPEAGVFRTTGALTTARMSHTAALMEDGRVLIAGGIAFEPATAPDGRNVLRATSLRAADIYDASKGTFTAAQPMARARSGHTIVPFPGGAWIMGGYGVSAPNLSEVFLTVAPSPQTAPISAVRETRPLLHLDFNGSGAQLQMITAATSVEGRRVRSFEVMSAVISPDGSRFVAFSDTGNADALVAAPIAGRSQIVFETASNENFTGWAPVWSPDGKQLAVTVLKPSSRQENGAEYSVVIIDADTWKVRGRHPIPEGTLLIPRHLSPPDKLRWSPDSRYLLISWENAIVLDLQQKKWIQISKQPVVADWTPRGDAIQYFEMANWERRRERALGGFFVKTLDTSARVEIASAAAVAAKGFSLNTDLHNGLLELSPSRAKLAVLQGAPGTNRARLRIYDVSANTPLDLSTPSRTIDLDDILVKLDWSPDEQSIAAAVIPKTAVLRTGPFGQPSIRILDLASGTWRAVTTINFDLRLEWPQSLELLSLHKLLSWTR